MTQEYLSFTEVAEALQITTGALNSYKLPEPDARIGKTRGWLPRTIAEWDANRARGGSLARQARTPAK